MNALDRLEFMLISARVWPFGSGKNRNHSFMSATGARASVMWR
jgi:hypothetical protein